MPDGASIWRFCGCVGTAGAAVIGRAAPKRPDGPVAPFHERPETRRRRRRPHEQRFRPPASAYRLLPSRRPRQDRQLHEARARVRHGLRRPHRSRRPLRRDQLLRGGAQGGGQADHRRGGLRRAARDAREERQGRRRELSPRAAGEERQGLPEPDQADEPGAHRRLLLQAADRSRDFARVFRRVDRPLRLPRCRGAARADRGELRRGEADRGALSRHLRAG